MGCSPCEAKRRAAAAAAALIVVEADQGWLADRDGNKHDHTNPVVIDPDGDLVLTLVSKVPNVWATRTPNNVTAVLTPDALTAGGKFVARINRRTRQNPYVNGYFAWLGTVDETGAIVENWHGASAEQLADQRIAPHPGWSTP